MTDSNHETEDKMKEATETNEAGVSRTINILAPAIIQAAGSIIGALFTGKGMPNDKVSNKVNALKNSKRFHWILLFGVGVIAIGAFIDGLSKIIGFFILLYGWMSAAIGL
ncbi:hypothetical protein EDB94_0341 [Marinobacter sp. 3-2]|jgi:hypothetical protein|uniref:hypothetical protein n=1 Tax=Marinobacter sp. 3-2 TaxID=2485141 RepID=UPI000D33A354|nr:hypothetical protein [Marinobacter sp. 3-2]ROQ48444.1 hypothetical protein EDB94_0341 [Marinobacter sp. 3-2]